MSQNDPCLPCYFYGRVNLGWVGNCQLSTAGAIAPTLDESPAQPSVYSSSKYLHLPHHTGRETNFPASAVVSRSRWSGHCLKREVGPYFSTWQRNRTPHQWYYPLKGRTVCHQFSFHIFISAQSLNYLKYQESTSFPGIYHWVAFSLKLNQTKAWTFSKHGIVRWSMVIHRSKGQ